MCSSDLLAWLAAHGEAGLDGEIRAFGEISDGAKALQFQLARAMSRRKPLDLAQLDVMEEEGLDPARIVIGHCDSWPRIDYWREIARRGATVEADFLGMSFTPLERAGEPKVIDLIKTILDEGHADRLMLSQDVCHDSQLACYGGAGYTYLQRTFLPRLVAAGVDAATVQKITVANPARILTLTAPR